jgi:hypothetical protein
MQWWNPRLQKDTATNLKRSLFHFYFEIKYRKTVLQRGYNAQALMCNKVLKQTTKASSKASPRQQTLTPISWLSWVCGTAATCRPLKG